MPVTGLQNEKGQPRRITQRRRTKIVILRVCNMTKRELIDSIARERLVEWLVTNVCHRHHRALPDLVQMVYEALLNYDGQKLLRIHQRSALNFFIVRVIGNLYFSRTSPYYRQIRKFSRMSDELRDE